MPFLTNPKREAFAQAYARGETAGKRGASYLAAGYKGDSESAARCAWRLMKDPRVTRRIAELQQECAASPTSPSFTRGDPMPSLSNPKHEAFAQAFVRGETAGNRWRSYLAAGYACDAKSAKEAASRLAKAPDVMRRIAELRQDMQAQETRSSEQAIARLAITKEAVLAELARIAFANILDYGQPDADGTFEVDLSEINRDNAAAIQEVIVTDVKRAGEDGKPMRRVRVKLASKRDALVDLGKHFGLFVDRRHGGEDYAELSEEELAARIRTVVGQLQRIGIDVASLFGLAEADLGGAPPTRPH